jgi:hypothetical protein
VDPQPLVSQSLRPLLWLLLSCQANIYSPERTFYSFKQVVRELQSACPLVSLHSTSKVCRP